MDNTRIPMGRGFVCLGAVADWFRRKVLAWRDNVFVERLWRTIKYEEVYLRAYDSVTAARQSLRRHIDP